MTKTQIAIIGFVGIIILVILLILIGVIPGLKKPGGNEPPPPPPRTEINFWGLAGEESAWADVIGKFESFHPSLKINYIGTEEEVYETTLLDNLAAGTGPDIMLFHYDWLSKHQNKIIEAPEGLITPEQITEIFPKVVGDTFVSGGKIYALPVSVPTLALIYNRTYFDAKAVSSIPQDWNDIKALIPKLREIKDGHIFKEAIALGGSSASVKNAPEILTLLSLQFEAMRGAEGLGGNTPQENWLSALEFYMDFSDPRSPNYTLDDSFQNSIDAFASGKTAIAIVYPKDIAKISKINQAALASLWILPMPQIDKDHPVNITSFWGLSVSRTSRVSNLAWDFINFAATNEPATQSYSTISGNPPALRSTISYFNNHPTLKVCAPQILNAKTYPKNNEPQSRAVADSMIKSALRDRFSLEAIVKQIQP